MPASKYSVKLDRGVSRDPVVAECVDVVVMEGGTLTKLVYSSVYDPKLDQFVDTGIIVPTSIIVQIGYIEYTDVEKDDTEEEEEEEEDDKEEVAMSIDKD